MCIRDRDAIDDGVLDGDQRIQRSQGQPVDKLLDKGVHVVTILWSEVRQGRRSGSDPLLRPRWSTYLNSSVRMEAHLLPSTLLTVSTRVVVSPYLSKATWPVTPSKETLPTASMV